MNNLQQSTNTKFIRFIKRNIPSILFIFAKNIWHVFKFKKSKMHINYFLKERKTIYLEIGLEIKREKMYGLH